MWISRRKYERLVRRIDDLEKQTYISCSHTSEPLGETVGHLLRHLGIEIKKPYCYPQVLTKK